MQLNEYIAELLKKHDCVIIPDFGGFIGAYKSAEIDEVRGMIYPPSKQLLFNPQLTSNDGLLGNAIAQNEEISYGASLERIEQTITEWTESLKTGGRIEIGKLGFLYKEEDRIVFEQSREINLLLAAYGLAPVKVIRKASEQTIQEQVFKPSVKEVEETVSEIVEEASQSKEEKVRPIIQINAEPRKEALITVVEPVVEESDYAEASSEEEGEEEKVVPIPRKKRKFIRYVAAAAILPIAFYSVWIPAKTDFLQTGTIQLSDFNPTAKQVERSYETRDQEELSTEEVEFKNWDELTGSLPENVTVYNYHFSENLYLPVRLNQETLTDNILAVDESTDVVETTIETTISESSSDKQYHLITGCFSVESNATNLVTELNEKGFSARILDKNNGLWRVTAGDYSERSTAKNAQSDLETQGYSNWILKQ